jgi:hypothetical protein
MKPTQKRSHKRVAPNIEGPSPQNSPDGTISPSEWESLGHLDRDARRKKYEEIAHIGSLKEQMMAMHYLEELDSASAVGLGPRPPLTSSEKIDRLSRLMCAIGEELTLQSLKVAKKYWKEEAKWIPEVIYNGQAASSKKGGPIKECGGPKTPPNNLE